MFKKSLFIFFVSAILFTGCSNNKFVDSKTIAHTLHQEQLENRQLTYKVDRYFGENVETYKRSDGKTLIYVYSSPIEKCCNLIKKEGNNQFVSKGDYCSKYFPREFSFKNNLCIRNNNDYINILPYDTGVYKGKISKQTNIFGQEKQAIVYENVFGEGQIFYCYSTEFGINTEIIIPKNPETASFKLKIMLPNLSEDTNSLDYILFKTPFKTSEVKSILYTPLLCDSSGNWSYANSVKLIEKDNETNIYTIEYTVDKDFLNNKNTKYPVTMNQSIYLYKTKQPDVSVYGGINNTLNHYLSPYMLLGDATIKGEGWALIRYETLNNLHIDPEKIVSAKYIFRNLFDLKKETKVSAYAVVFDWCSVNIRWYNRPPFDKRPVGTVLIQKKGDYEINLTPFFKEILKNRIDPNALYSVENSFMIKCDTKNSNIIFPSGDNGLFSPLLEIVLSE